MLISVLVARGKNGEIGKDNSLLWHLPKDLKRFKALTQGNAVIMGRKTFESIGKPLPNRINIVITKSKLTKIDGCVMANSIEDAIIHAKMSHVKEAFIIGGGQIYNLAEDFADRYYITEVDASLEADTYYKSKLDPKKWNLISSETHAPDEKHAYTFQFDTYERL